MAKIITDTLGLSPAQAAKIARLYHMNGVCALCNRFMLGDRFVLAQPYVNNSKQIALVLTVACGSCSKRIEQTMNLCAVILDPSDNGTAKP